MAHFYFAQAGQRLLPGHTVSLDAEESRHACSVARLKVGERVLVGDGHGAIAQAEATSVSPERVELVVIDVELRPEPTPPLWLVQSLAKGGRDEQALEQSTEVGVQRVFALAAERCIVRWEGPKREKALARWQKIHHEASKQALQPRLAEVSYAVSLEQLLTDDPQVTWLLLDHHAPHSLSDMSVSALPTEQPIGVIVGPEGGWSERERAVCESHSVLAVRLGPGVLRSSSAGPIALALLHQQLGHW